MRDDKWTDKFDILMGLENIKSRVKYLKGDISVSSDSDKGTSTLIHIPIG